VRVGAIIIVVCLVLFGGSRAFKFFDRKRVEYQQLVKEAKGLKQEIQLYEDKTQAVKRLMESFNLDPARLYRTTAVAEASAAIQKAATSSGIAVGPIRESPARPSSQELASIQMEATGPVPAITALLGRLQTVGYPLVVETVQLTQEASRPGMVKMSLTMVILDFDQWKKGGTPNA